LLNIITIIADSEFHVVEGFYESVPTNAETVLRVLGELAPLGLFRSCRYACKPIIILRENPADFLLNRL
jgi:hypothetical protein